MRGRPWRSVVCVTAFFVWRCQTCVWAFVAVERDDEGELVEKVAQGDTAISRCLLFISGPG